MIPHAAIATFIYVTSMFGAPAPPVPAPSSAPQQSLEVAKRAKKKGKGGDRKKTERVE